MIDEIKPVGPAGISIFSGVAELVEHCGKLDAQFADASTREEGSFLVILRAGKYQVFFNVALRLPDIARVRLENVDNEERDAISILLVKFVKGRNLPPERRSGVAAEYQDHRLCGGKRGQPHAVRLVQF